MKDADTNLQEIKDRVLAFAKERDWEQFHAPKNLSMAIAAEAAELMEHFLWQSPEGSLSDMESENLRSKVEEELADVFIFAIEFANMTGTDIAAIIKDLWEIDLSPDILMEPFNLSTSYNFCCQLYKFV